MGVPAKKLIRLLVEHDPASPEFRDGVRGSLRPQLASARIASDELWLWKDVFVQQKLPWGRFIQSAVLHAVAFTLVWAISFAWLRQQRILVPAFFDRTSLITYSPQEYLPPLDTGAAETPKAQTGDPVFAKQPILSVPREADNRTQTIVVPPDVKLDHDVPLPNIVAAGAIAPVVPLDATRGLSHRLVVPQAQVVEPAPDVDVAREHTAQAALKSDVIAPPPEVKSGYAHGVAGPETAVVEPPPDLKAAAKSHVGSINIGPSEVVAPAPVLTLAEQHALYSRGGGAGKDLPGGVQPVGPPPSVAASGGGSAQGRLIALGIHPVVPTGPVAVPGGNRRGVFSAGPKGKAGASGTPDSAGSKSASNGFGGAGNGGSGSGFKGHGNGSLPAGLYVGAGPGATGSIERNGDSSGGDGDGDSREMASLSPSRVAPDASSHQHAASAVSEDKVTAVDRQVFGERRPYAMTVNMPNLNSSTGSWVIRFAELHPAELSPEQKQAELLAPVATEKTDPGYPLELIRANIHGPVTLYAVIHTDGRVGDIRVLSSPDDRLDAWATSALSHWKFLPALRAGKPVPLEAVVVIPFRVRKAF